MRVQQLHEAFALFADSGDYEVYADENLCVAARDIAPDSIFGERLQKLGWEYNADSGEWVLDD